MTHLTVALHGFVRVLKTAAPPGEAIISEPAVPLANSKRSQYTGNGHASLFNNEVTLCGEGRLEPGIYEFEFNEPLPARDLPTSIDVCCLNPPLHHGTMLTSYSLKGVQSPT